MPIHNTICNSHRYPAVGAVDKVAGMAADREVVLGMAVDLDKVLAQHIVPVVDKALDLDMGLVLGDKAVVGRAGHCMVVVDLRMVGRLVEGRTDREVVARSPVVAGRWGSYKPFSIYARLLSL